MKVDWPSATFYGIAQKYPSVRVNVITLKSHYEEVVNNLVLNDIIPTDSENDNVLILIEHIKAKSKILMNQGLVSVCEFVVRSPQDITVCLDVDKVDDSAIMQALNRISECDFDWSKDEERLSFGEFKSFKSYELKTYG